MDVSHLRHTRMTAVSTTTFICDRISEIQNLLKMHQIIYHLLYSQRQISTLVYFVRKHFPKCPYQSHFAGRLKAVMESYLVTRFGQT